MLPGRLGTRFALEALFLVLLAVGAGLADLRPMFIVLVMAAAWLLVALIELTAERIARAPASYLLPEAGLEAEQQGEEEPERVFEPPVEERTVVAPPEAVEVSREPAAEAEEPPEPEAAPQPEPVPVPAPEPAPLEPAPAAEVEAPDETEADSLELPRRRLGLLRRRPQPVAAAEPALEPGPQALPEPQSDVRAEPEPSAPGRRRSLFRRREPEPEPELEPPPRHVKLLPRRPAQAAPASTEVAGLFEASEESADAEETAG